MTSKMLGLTVALTTALSAVGISWATTDLLSRPAPTETLVECVCPGDEAEAPEKEAELEAVEVKGLDVRADVEAEADVDADIQADADVTAKQAEAQVAAEAEAEAEAEADAAAEAEAAKAEEDGKAVTTRSILGLCTVTVAVVDGALQLIDVSAAPGVDVEIDSQTADQIHLTISKLLLSVGVNIGLNADGEVDIAVDP